MITISSRDVSKWLTKITKKIVRTYKGDIERNQLGDVIKFPASFLTIGFDLEWFGPRDELEVIHQLLLANDTFEFIVYQVHDNDYKGDFSATSTGMEDASDRKEKYITLTASIVNKQHDVKNHSGGVFGIKLMSNNTAVVTGSFGQSVTVPSAYRNYKVYNKTAGEAGGYLPTETVLLGDIWIGS